MVHTVYFRFYIRTMLQNQHSVPRQPQHPALPQLRADGRHERGPHLHDRADDLRGQREGAALARPVDRHHQRRITQRSVRAHVGGHQGRGGGADCEAANLAEVCVGTVALYTISQRCLSRICCDVTTLKTTKKYIVISTAAAFCTSF
jgi:hypothetical protein